MTMNYGKVVGAPAHQSEQQDPRQVRNNAGGFSFAVDKWGRLARFLVLGTEGGTYYVGERELTLANTSVVEECLKENEARTVDMIREFSSSGRAPKNDPALFALAIAARRGSESAKRLAYRALPEVARIGTHLFHWASYMKALGGLSGNGAKGAIARWYNDRLIGNLVLQVTKYQQRDGWSHRDLLRLAHPKTGEDQRKDLYHWVVKGWEGVGETPHPNEYLARVWAFERAKTARGKELVKLIADYALPHECVPNEAKNDPAVWEAMLTDMGATAMIRNLAKMTSVGLVAPLSAATKKICERLADPHVLKQGRVHPLSILQAARVYHGGHGVRGSLSWTPVEQIETALDKAFYLAFKTIEPTGKRWYLGVDVSGSMGGGEIAGMGLTPREGAAAMALVTAETESQSIIRGFSGGMRQLNVKGAPLATVIERMSNMDFDRTDCAVPMVDALNNKIPVDVFVVYTDNETWAGPVHPHMALRNYRQKMGIAARMIVVGFTATELTVADPTDAGMMDVVGFDSAAPAVMADFARGTVGA